MGFLSCPLPCQNGQESQSQTQANRLHSVLSASASLPSQPSLPSVASLTPPTHHHPPPVQSLCLTTLKGHTSAVSSLTLAGELLLTGSSDSEIRAWNRNLFGLQPSSDNVVAVTSGAVKSMAVLGDKLFTAHQDHKIRVWKFAANQKFKHVSTLPTINDRFSKFLSAKNYVEVRRHKKCTWVHHVDSVSALAISRDGTLLYSASWDRSFKIWRTRDFKCLQSVDKAHDDAINAIVLSDDGLAYTGSADQKIKVWKKHEKQRRHFPLATLEKHKSAVNALALSSDGTVLYSGACDRSILVWQRERTSEPGGDCYVVAGALRGHTKAILCLAVVSDFLCSGSADGTVRIWRRVLEKNYACLATLEGHKRPIKCLAVAVDTSGHDSGDGSAGVSYLVYSGSLDSDVKVWQIRI